MTISKSYSYTANEMAHFFIKTVRTLRCCCASSHAQSSRFTIGILHLMGPVEPAIEFENSFCFEIHYYTNFWDIFA